MLSPWQPPVLLSAMCSMMMLSHPHVQVTRSERIRGAQSLSGMRAELRELAVAKRLEKGSSAHAAVASEGGEAEDEEGEDGLSPWTPEERVRMYREMAEQKEEQERSKSHMQPKKRCVSTTVPRLAAECSPNRVPAIPASTPLCCLVPQGLRA